MILMILVILFLLTLILYEMHAFWGVTIWLLVSVGLFYGAGSGWIPHELMADLQENSTSVRIQGPTSIIVLGGGTMKNEGTAEVRPGWLAHSRLLEATRLYMECRTQQVSCLVVPSGGDPVRNGKTEAEVMAAQLHGLGVPTEDILLESKSLNTFQNAQFTKSLLESQGKLGQRSIVVTSGFHLRRALTYFRHFFTQVDGSPSDYLEVRPSAWPKAMNLAMTDLALAEFVGLGQYRFYNWMGWNPPPVAQP